MDFWRNLFNGTGFVPRTQCGDWSGALITLHVVSDTVIWLCYLWIPLVMIWSYQRHRRSLILAGPLAALLGLYVVFITACGWTHFFDALMFYTPAYRVNGVVRLVTALASIATAISLVRLMPAAITAPITILTQKSTLKQQQEWLRDILDAATDGVLKLCTDRTELPPVPETAYEGAAARVTASVDIRTSSDLRRARIALQKVAEKAGFPLERAYDLTSALHEATMNALVHAGSGTVHINATPDLIQVWVEDHGKGIPLDKLPIATLKQGFSSVGTAGQGWFLVLTFVDRAFLLTGPDGTTLVLEMAAQDCREHRVPFSEAVGGDVHGDVLSEAPTGRPGPLVAPA